MGIDLSVNIGSVKFPNPVMVASGTFGYGTELQDLVDIERLGGIITKTVTLSPRIGNPPPRITETRRGMLNAIGLENKGVDDFINQKLPQLLNKDVLIIASIAGDNIAEYVELAKKLDRIDRITALELNISCPNIKAKGKLMFSQDARATYKLIKAVKKSVKTPVIAKLSPNVTDIVSIAKAAEDAGSDAVALVNTFLGIAVDINTRKPKLANSTGGLSGPAIKPLALRCVWQAARETKIPIIGMGGIMNSDDAIEFIIAGASLICVGTANFIDPNTAVDIIDGIKDYMAKNNITDIKELAISA